MRRLASQRQVTRTVPVETGTDREQRRDPGRPFLGENPDTFSQRQTGARRQRVLGCAAGESPGPIAAATPPCAIGLDPP